MVLAEPRVEPAHHVARSGPPRPVVNGIEQGETFFRVVKRILVAPLPLKQVGDVEVHVSLTGGVTGLLGELQRVLEVGVGVVEAAEQSVGARQVAVGVCLPLAVAEPLRGGNAAVWTATLSCQCPLRCRKSVNVQARA